MHHSTTVYITAALIVLILQFSFSVAAAKTNTRRTTENNKKYVLLEIFVSQTACGEAKKCMRPYSLMSVCLSAWEVLHVCIPKPTKEPISHISSLEAELL